MDKNGEPYVRVNAQIHAKQVELINAGVSVYNAAQEQDVQGAIKALEAFRARCDELEALAQARKVRR